jgi:hypothetical protein
MKDPLHPNAEGNSKTKDVQDIARPSGQDRQEQYQRSRERAAGGQEEQDRDARLRRRAHEYGRPKADPHVMQMTTGAARLRASTGKTLLSSATALLARSGRSAIRRRRLVRDES